MSVTYEHITYLKIFKIFLHKILYFSETVYIYRIIALAAHLQPRRGKMAGSRVTKKGKQFAERTRPKMVIGQWNPLTMRVRGTVAHLYPSGKVVIEYRSETPNVRWVPVRLILPGEYPEPADLA